MAIQYSTLRILIISNLSTPIPDLFKGNSHHEIANEYYKASIPIWRDELPTTESAIHKWQEEWTKTEAGEVIHAVGAWVENIRKLLSTVHAVIENHTASSFSISERLLLAVGMQQTSTPSLEVSTEQWDELCQDCGSWEWIDGSLDESRNDSKEAVRNEFGEQVGMARLREALEAHEWESGNGETLSDDSGSGDAFGEEAVEMEREMMGLKLAVQENEGSEEQTGVDSVEVGGDEEVQELETMMLKMQAVKDMGAHMPEAERKRFAAKAVSDVMKTL